MDPHRQRDPRDHPSPRDQSAPEPGCLVGAVIEDELQGAGQSQPEPPPHFASQEATGVGETNPNFPRAD